MALLDKLIKKWAKRLDLEGWKIDVQIVEPGQIVGHGNSRWLGECDWDPELKEIYIALTELREDKLLHELVHVKFELTSLLIQHLPTEFKLALTLAEDQTVTVMTRALLLMDKQRRK